MEEERDHRRPCAGEHSPVREEGGGAEEAEGDAGEDRGEGGEEDVGCWDRGGVEGRQEVFACVEGGVR